MTQIFYSGSFGSRLGNVSGDKLHSKLISYNLAGLDTSLGTGDLVILSCCLVNGSQDVHAGCLLL